MRRGHSRYNIAHNVKILTEIMRQMEFLPKRRVFVSLRPLKNNQKYIILNMNITTCAIPY